MAKGKSKRSPAELSRTGKRSRRKGKVFEREVAAEYRAIYGESIKRGWQAREGHDAPDVENVPDLWVEAKHHQRVNYRAALEQAEEALEKAKAPITVRPIAHCKDDGQKAVVIIRQEHWFALLKELNQHREAAKIPKKGEKAAPVTAAQKVNGTHVADPFTTVLHLAQPPNGVEG